MTKPERSFLPEAGAPASSAEDQLLCDLIAAELADRFCDIPVCAADVEGVVREMTGASQVDVKFFELTTGGSRCEVTFT